MRNAGLVVLAVAGLLAGCDGPPPPRAEPRGGARTGAADSVSAAARPDSVRDRFVRYGLGDLGSTRAEVRDRLGEPDRVVVEPFTNRHDPTQTDSLFELRYEGLVLTFYHVSGGRDLLSAAVVTDNRYLAYPAVRIGMRWDEVRPRLGEPDATENGVHEYGCASCLGADNPVYIHVRDGTVNAVRFTYYVD